MLFMAKAESVVSLLTPLAQGLEQSYEFCPVDCVDRACSTGSDFDVTSTPSLHP